MQLIAVFWSPRMKSFFLIYKIPGNPDLSAPAFYDAYFVPADFSSRNRLGEGSAAHSTAADVVHYIKKNWTNDIGEPVADLGNYLLFQRPKPQPGEPLLSLTQTGYYTAPVLARNVQPGWQITREAANFFRIFQGADFLDCHNRIQHPWR
jgi:hypothetical protein